MILGVHHAQISIPKGAEDQARAFYCGVLGMIETPKPEDLKGRGGFWLQLGEMQVHFGTEDGVDRLATRAHVAYEVSDLTGIRKTIEKQGIKTKDGLPIPGQIRFECRDPFGNRMEFLQRIF